MATGAPPDVEVMGSPRARAMTSALCVRSSDDRRPSPLVRLRSAEIGEMGSGSSCSALGSLSACRLLLRESRKTSSVAGNIAWIVRDLGRLLEPDWTPDPEPFPSGYLGDDMVGSTDVDAVVTWRSFFDGESALVSQENQVKSTRMSSFVVSLSLTRLHVG